MFAVAAVCGLILASHAPAPPLTADTAAIRKELEAWYEQNASAYQRWDFDAIMALRSPDFRAIGQDGTTRDRAAMELYIQGFLNGVKRVESPVVHPRQHPGVG